MELKINNHIINIRRHAKSEYSVEIDGCTNGCGNCMECRKQKKREWQIRMNEEIKNDRTGKFITLTFSNEELQKLIQETGIQESNAVATIAVRRFLERWRKKYKKSVKHFLITELGHNGTERIHLHGILFTNEKKKRGIQK